MVTRRLSYLADVRPGDECSDADRHTPQPRGYVAWHDWVERVAETHDQIRCDTCGLYAIWVPKPQPQPDNRPKEGRPWSASSSPASSSTRCRPTT